MKKIYPNCSEYISKLEIKKSEIPYIKKRVNELFSEKDDRKYLLQHFLEMVGVPDVSLSFIETDNVEPYNKIYKEEKANDLSSKKEKDFLFSYYNCLKETYRVLKKGAFFVLDYHREELKFALRDIDEEEFHQLKKEIILEEL